MSQARLVTLALSSLESLAIPLPPAAMQGNVFTQQPHLVITQTLFAGELILSTDMTSPTLDMCTKGLVYSCHASDSGHQRWSAPCLRLYTQLGGAQLGTYVWH